MFCKRLVTCPGCTLVPYNSPRFPATLNWISRSECMDGWSHKRMYVWLYQITNKYKRKLDLKRECHSRCDNNKCEFKKELDTSVFKMCVKKNSFMMVQVLEMWRCVKEDAFSLRTQLFLVRNMNMCILGYRVISWL